MSEPARPLTVEELLSHSGWIERVARTLVRDAARAEDVVQETWLAALKSPPRDAGRIESWLYSVMKNVARMQARSEGSRRSREAAVARRDLDVDGADLVARAESQKLVISHVVALDEPYRTTLLLHYYDDLSASEIAARFGVPTETVRTRLRRALDRIRETMRARDGDRWPLALAPLVGGAPFAPTGTPDAADRIPARRAGARRAARWSVAAAVVVAVGLTASWLAARGVGGAGDGSGAPPVERVADASSRRPDRAGSPEAAPAPRSQGVAGAAAETGATPPAPAGPAVAFRATTTASGPADAMRGVRFRFHPQQAFADASVDVVVLADVPGTVEARLPVTTPSGKQILGFDVVVDDPAIVPWRTRIDVPRPDAPPARFDPLSRAAVVTGRATAADGGALRDAMAVATEAAYPNTQVDLARVADDGSYRLRLRPGVEQTVAVVATDRAPRVFRLTPDGPAGRALEDAVLGPGATLAGTVVDSRGDPVAGAGVSLQSPYLAEGQRAGIHRLTTSGDRIRFHTAGRVTGADGRFAFGGLDLVEHVVDVSPPGATAPLLGRLRWTVTPGGAEALFRVDAAVLRLSVLRGGVPVPKLRFGTTHEGRQKQFVTDDLGEAVLLVPPDEEAVLEFAGAPDAVVHRVRAGAAGETVSATVDLAPPADPATWRVRLTGLPATSRGLCGIRLFELDRSEPSPFPPVRDVPFVGDEFVVAGLTPGRYRALVRPGTSWHDPANRCSEIAAEFVLSPGQETRSELQVTPAGRLSVVVRDPEGKRVGARCDLRDAAGNRITVVSRVPGANVQGENVDRVEADGPTAVFPTLTPGRYVLVLEEVGFLPGRAEFEIRAGEVTEVETTLRR